MKRFVSAFLVFALLFLSVPNVSFAAVSDEELEGFLAEREITREQLEEHLDYYYDMSVEDFDDLEDLSWHALIVKGNDPDGNSNLDTTLEYFEITYDELVEFLSENGASLDDFVFINELEEYLWEYYDWDEDWDWDEIPYYDGLFTEFEFTWKELGMLFEHLEKVVTEDPNTVEKLEALYERIQAFDGFETAKELKAEEIAELFSIGTDMINVLKLQSDYYLVKVGEQKPISYTDLMNLNKLEGYSLLVVLSDQGGNELADFVITADMFNAVFMKKAGSDFNDAAKGAEKVKEEKSATSKKPAKPSETKQKATSKTDSNTTSKKVTKTVDGAKMPKTATSYPAYAMIGLFMTVCGAILFRKLKMAS